MSCSKFEFLISKKIDNQITKKELSALNAHLQNCRNCQKTLESFQRTRSVLLKTKTVPEKIPNLKFKVLDKIQQQKEESKKVIFVNFTRKHLILAAGFIFVVLASFAFWQTLPKKTSEQVDLSWYYECENMDLTDGYGYDLTYF